MFFFYFQETEEAFYLFDVGDVILKYNAWLEKLPRVTPFYGESPLGKGRHLTAAWWQPPIWLANVRAAGLCRMQRRDIYILCANCKVTWAPLKCCGHCGVRI